MCRALESTWARMISFLTVLLFVIISHSSHHVQGFINPTVVLPFDTFISYPSTRQSIKSSTKFILTPITHLSLAKNDRDQQDDDNEKESWSFGDQPNLGINIGKQLNPLTPEQAEELKEEATQTINEAFGERIDEIAALKKQVRKDFDRTKENLRYASDQRTKEQTEKLMGKIDRLSGDFLESTRDTRVGTKLAATADKNMSGKGIDLGSWGKIGGLDILTTSSDGSVGLLGSVDAASTTSSKAVSDGDEITRNENKILIICDGKQVR